MSDKSFWKGKRVVVTGGRGFLGSYVCQALQEAGVEPDAIVSPSSKESDLRDFGACRAVLEGADVVLHLAAVTGGIAFSRAHPAAQYRDSTFIDLNVIEAAREAGVAKCVTLGNLFAYPASASLPLNEETLFGGLPNDAHVGVGWMKRNLAVIAKLYWMEFEFPVVVVFSANAYGPRDSVDRSRAHVIPATIMKCLLDNEIVVWGDGTPVRDFLFTSDIAAGILAAAEKLEAPGLVNIGSGKGVTVRELIEKLVRVTGFQGSVTFDESRKGGDAGRVADNSRAKSVLGFSPKVSLDDGLKQTVEWYRGAVNAGRVK